MELEPTIPRRPAGQADSPSLSGDATLTRRRRSAGPMIIRAPEADGDQGGHQVLRGQGKTLSCFGSRPRLMLLLTSAALADGTPAGRGPDRLPLAQVPRVPAALDLARRRPGRAGARAGARTLPGRRDPAPGGRLRPLRRVNFRSMQLIPDRRRGRRRHGPEVQAARPVRPRPLRRPDRRSDRLKCRSRASDRVGRATRPLAILRCPGHQRSWQ